MMGKENIFAQHELKVSKVLTVILWSGALAGLLLSFFDVFSTYTASIINGSIALFVTLVVRMAINNKYLPLIITLSFFVVLLSYALSIYKASGVIMCFSVCVVATYFNKRYIIANTILSFIAMIYLKFGMNVYDTKNFMATITIFMFSAICLIALTIWAREFIVAAKNKEEEAKNNLAKVISFTEKIANGNIEKSNSTEQDSITEQFSLITGSIQGVINEIDSLTNSVLEGDLAARGNIENFKGSYSKIIQSVNNTIEAFLSPIRESSAVLTELAKGNLKVSVKGDYKGDFAILKDSLNISIESLLTYIGDISEVLGRISSGDLDVEIKKEYQGDFVEIKNSINLAIESFNKVLATICISAKEVAGGSQQIADGANNLSQSAAEQAATIEELIASMDDVETRAKQNASDANQASELALASKVGAMQGNEQMQEMLNAMSEITASSTNISKIIKVIDEIAFQTNILALNAAVEAARAGQYGRGFAVVAEEVRNLANKSADAAKQTTELIEMSIKKTENGMQIADNTAIALNNVVNEIAKVSGLIGNIAVASNEQNNSIEQINIGITQVSEVIQHNSATAQENAAASEEMFGQAEALKNIARQFKLKNIVVKDTISSVSIHPTDKFKKPSTKYDIDMRD